VTPIRVVIVDDHPLFRKGLRDAFETDREIEVVGEAENGQEALQLAEELEPDVILMDISLPDIMGLQVTRRVKAKLPDIKVVAVTGYDDIEQAFHAIRAGASAYTPKEATGETLIGIVKAVRQGLFVVGSQRMTYDEVLNWVEEKVGDVAGMVISDTEDSFVPLSPREMEILEHVTYGKSNKEIAYELGISHQTVKNHMTAILRKLSVDDRTQAAVYALTRGWVRLEKPLRD
jgi:DNA-binding NarL/FixJ family response regulator